MKIEGLLLILILIGGCIQNTEKESPSNQDGETLPYRIKFEGKNIVYGQTNSKIEEDDKEGFIPTINATSMEIDKGDITKLSSQYKEFGKNFQFSKNENQQTYVYVFDVGYGESILIKKGDFEILFDAGRNETSKKLVSELQRLGINKIEALVITSDDEKRFGGSRSLFENFPISEIWTNGDELGGTDFQEVSQYAAAYGVPIRHPEEGDEVEFNGMVFRFLNPQKDRFTQNKDANSIVVKITDRQFCLLLTSNIERGIENKLVGSGGLRCEVLKIAKYGSASSTDLTFLVAVEPKDALLSVGPNKDGYPNPTSIEKMKVLNIKLYRTDLDGNIIIQSNGTTYQIRTEKRG
ncbi:MAG: hypothetical protein QXW70_04135 [Candidatus Anstonellales archaeon]